MLLMETGGEAEIREFYMTILINEDVVRFNVTKEYSDGGFQS